MERAPSLFRDYLEALGVVALITIGGALAPLGYHALGCIYLLGVIVLSLRVRRGPILAGAVLSGLAWDYFFVPPRLTFAVLHREDGLLLVGYLVAGFIGGKIEALRSSAERGRLLAESARMQQALLDNVAHELKTPVAALHSAVDQFASGDAARRERLVGELRIAVERLGGLVENLLNQSRLDSGALKPHLDWCDAHEVVVGARRSAGSRLDGRPLDIAIPDDFPLLRADAVLLEQALAHLLLNAAVHAPPPGRIRVEAGPAADRRLFLAVSDEGPGVPPGLREGIFERFRQGPAGRPRGLGLGLSIVRGFMRAQGGDVALESPPGGGARFVLFLPRPAPQPIPAE